MAPEGRIVPPSTGPMPDLPAALALDWQPAERMEILARLGGMLADLESHIARKAAELAQPLIDAACRNHAAEMAVLEERRASERDRAVRAEDLVAELRKIIATRERQLEQAGVDLRG